MPDRNHSPLAPNAEVTRKCVLLLIGLLLMPITSTSNTRAPEKGIASWYGEQHRGRLMANGKKFDPDKLTAASWYYPFGTRVKVTLRENPSRSVVVTITDRGPAWRLVREGRIIDLGHAAFRQLAPPTRGLVPVTVKLVGS